MKATKKPNFGHAKDTIQLNTFVPIVLRDRIQYYAEKEQRPLSGYVRWILTKHIEALDAQEGSSAQQHQPITKSA